MMTLEQVQRALQDRKLPVVASETKLSYQTVWRIASGNIKRTSYESIKKLSDYLEQ